MKFILYSMLTVLIISAFSFYAEAEPYRIELEEYSIPGSPAIHSFAFAESGGKWLFIGGRINGLHGFTTMTSFPKQFSNVNVFVVDPSTGQTWSRNIFQDFHFTFSDQFRSTNMQYFQSGNKLYISGGYGYDSTVNNLVTFSKLTVIDVNETIAGIINGTPVNLFARQLNDSRMQVCGGEMMKLGDYVILAGGHVFTGPYRRVGNIQAYTNQIRKFKIIDDGITVGISDYSAFTDTIQFHRRDMNLYPAIKPNGSEEYLILFGGVFKSNIDLPFLNPIEISENQIEVNFGYEQKMSHYTCAGLQAFNSITGDYHSTFFGGISLYYFDENTNTLKADSLVPFIKDITTITRFPSGAYNEYVSDEKLPALLGSNAKFILNKNVSHFQNGVIKLNELQGRTLAGHIYGGIESLAPNNGVSYPSSRIFRVFITPEAPMPVELAYFTSSVNERNVDLSWKTSGELNNRGFYVERKDASDLISGWKELAFIPGVGNSLGENIYVYKDKKLNSGFYRYRLKQTDFNGSFEYYELRGDVVIGLPGKFFLTNNYPNPFNPVTKIDYGVPQNAQIKITVYDISGNEIAVLENAFKTAGYYTAEFSGSSYSSGVYFYNLEADGKLVDSKRMMLLK